MNFCAKIMHIWGWKMIYSIQEPPKSVICVVPHTSNYDFIIGKLFYGALNKKADFFMKKEWFFFPLGLILKKMGGVPVDRNKRASMTQQLIAEFNMRDSFHLAITPEGTRKPNPNWKKGFYYIAKGAGVPIQLAYVDYGKKEVGVTEIIYPTDNEEKDFEKIYSFYRSKQAKKPKNFVVPEY